MPVNGHLNLLTAHWRERTSEFESMFVRLAADLLVEEDCRVSIFEVPDDGNLHVRILRPSRTRIWSDGWSLHRASDGRQYQYDKTYEGDDPSTAEVEDSLRRMLTAAPSRVHEA
jgi:hypothetical protein